MFGSSGGGLLKGLTSLALLIAALGGLAVFGFTNSDLANFFQARAEAEKIHADTAWQEQLRQTELPYIKAEREAQARNAIAQIEQEAQILVAETEAKLAHIEAEKAAYAAQLEETRRVEMERNNQQLTAEARMVEVHADLIWASGLAVILVLAAVSLKALLRLVERLLGPQIVPQRVLVGQWDDPNFRRQQIESARRREQLERQPTITPDYTQNRSRFRQVITDPWET